MSISVSVFLYGKPTLERVKEVLTKRRMLSPASDGDASDFYVCGFGYHYSSHEEDESATLSNTTWRPMSFQGELRRLQNPVAHVVAQALAVDLNVQTAVVPEHPDPVSDPVYYYRLADSCEGNRCQVREEDDGEWKSL
jgi:hypothetical protein